MGVLLKSGMKIYFIFIFLFLAAVAGLIFLPRPAQKFMLELEKGYSIERLTYLPGGYEIPESAYIDMGSSAANRGLLEVKAANESYFVIFRQMRSEAGATLSDAKLSDKYPVRSEETLNDIPVTVYTSLAGELNYVWEKGGKRYEIDTNDPFITKYEVGRVQKGIEPLVIDALKPAKDFIESLKQSN